MLKICGECKEAKSLNCFNKNGAVGILRNNCKDCYNKKRNKIRKLSRITKAYSKDKYEHKTESAYLEAYSSAYYN